MAHLQQTRTGWQNEHLSSFLLSQFCFLSHPLTVADDLGVDFLCTLFEPRQVEDDIQLFPKQAFAIQIKSSPDPVEVEGKLDYLRGLEVPFFVGIVDQPTATLSIYSGELLPEFFSSVGAGIAMRLDPKDAFDYAAQRTWPQTPQGKFKLPVPLVGRLRVGDSPEKFEAIRLLMLRKCGTMLRNIATAVSREYVFTYPGAGMHYYQIVAGPGSTTTFRTNLMLRLAESFYNLKFIFRYDRAHFVPQEFAELEQCYLALRLRGFPVQEIVQPLYQDLRDALDHEAAAAAAPPA